MRKNITVIKYDHIWIIRMSKYRFSEKEPDVFKRNLKNADTIHLEYLLKILINKEEFLGCYFIKRRIDLRKKIFNRKTIILNKKWNTLFTTTKI